MDGSRVRTLLRTLIDVAAVATSVVFVASYFPTSVMLAPTTTNGGDMASHMYAASYLRNELLPHGRVVGWCPGNYCGFPLFQFYFPLPFLAIALASYAIPLNVAFKLGSQLGTVLLPLCAYLSLRSGAVPFPGPALAALATLPFIFMEANSMWGGNIPSTLAGEFAFSLGVALAVLFVGTLRRAVDTGRGRAWNGLLVALVGLAHGYTLLWAGFTSLAELVVLRGWWRRLGTLVAIHGLAILLLGFWLLPLLAYSPWTTVYSYVWIINSWQEIVPRVLWPAAIVAVVTALVLGAVSLARREPFPRMLATLWAGTLMGILFYFTARTFHVVDIRFFPFLQLGLCLTAAAGVGYLAGRLPMPEIWPLACACAVLPFVQSRVTFIPSWINWNYSGFERKLPWPTFRDINAHLHGDFRDPRVVYEHSPDHEALGTVRAFEDLPLFSGRSTLEGLYMQASPTAPFVFYVQSEVSQLNSCPFPDWGCARLDLNHGVDHMRMFNVSQYIVRSQQAKLAAATHPGLEHEKTVGLYDIYRLKENDGRYAVALRVAPALVVTPEWKPAAYRWFKRARPEDPVPVFAESASDEDRRAFSLAYAQLPAEIPRQPLPDPPVLAEHMETDRITVTGCRPGHPVLLRISYHPRWKAMTGERVWLAGPSFMLVFPKGERVDLVFDGGGPVTLGHLLTLVGCVILAVGVLPVRRRALAALRPVLELPPIPAATTLVVATGRWTRRTRGVLLGAALAIVAVVFAGAAVHARAGDADSTYRQGQTFYGAGRLAEAVPYFHRARQLAPLSMSAIHSTYFEGMSLYRQDKWAEAAETFTHFVAEFPEAQAAAESDYHLGLCRARLGNQAGAIEAWRDTQQRFADTPWAKYAGERLAEVVGKGTGG
jgi:tetratricopeptide (TPR) repeat protein